MELHNNWREEKRSAHLYSVMAAHENNILHKKLFSDLQSAAEKQAILWEKKIHESGQSHPGAYKPDARTRIVSSLIKLLGAERLHSILSAMKIRGMSIFTDYHAEHKHTSFNATSNLRAAVFGVNDGLISNASLILGVAGANADQHTIVIAGIAGLLAGAFSMGAGEYISVRSQREVFEYQIAIEKQELEEYPEEEIEELSLIYQARGVPVDEANKLSRLMIENPETGLNTLAREELGINPEDMVSPVGAMLSSFIAFGAGATVPLLPFIFGHSDSSLLISISLTGATLFGIGAMLSLFTNRNPLLLGLRMMTIGAVAGSVTYMIGKMLGVVM
jgi:VIT1/CCC1 family predicted Fe2+/Mn2+ transporter